MKILCRQIRPPLTTYVSNRIAYVFYNITVQCLYNDGKQKADIKANNTIEVAGGTIEFMVNANYSITRTGASVYGWVYGKI